MNNSWTTDIQAWINTQNDTSRSYDVSTISKLLQDEGWNPSKYSSSMKTKLHDYLTKWYFLAEKQMPTPATSLRRNPMQTIVEDRVDLIKERRQTVLWDGNKVRTTTDGKGYISYAWNRGKKSHVIHSEYIDEAMLNHNDIIEEVLDGSR